MTTQRVPKGQCVAPLVVVLRGSTPYLSRNLTYAA